VETKPVARPDGESANIVPINVPVPVQRLRDRMDPAAADGVPAHVTLIYPFLPPSELRDDVRRRIEQIVATEPAFRVTLASVGRFPEIVYLEPQPVDPFVRLTRSLAAAFPDYPPYEGAHTDIIPHLTIVHGAPADYIAAAEHALPALLPINDFVREAWLIGHTPEQPWHTLWRLPLGAARPG
jgi:2'-5' RNA ligase